MKKPFAFFLPAACLLLLILPSARLAWSSRDMPQLGHFHDDGMYWVTAQSLALGSGYRILSLPGTPAAGKYPPLFPLYLSIAWRASPSFPGNSPWLALLTWLPYPALVALSWRFLSKLLPDLLPRVLACVMLALSPTTVALSILALSHLMFCVLLLASLILAEKVLAENVSWPVIALAGIIGAAAYLTRTAALPLLISVPAVFVLKRRYRAAFLFLAFMSPAVIGWMTWSARNRVPSSDPTLAYYTDYMGYYFQMMSVHVFPVVLKTNIIQFFASVGDVFVNGIDGRFLGLPPGLVPAVISFLGIVKLVRRGFVLQYAAFSVLYILMLVVWHYQPTDSVVLPIFPLLLAGFFTQLWDIGRKMARLRPRLTAAAAIALFVFVGYRNADTIGRTLPAFIEDQRRITRSNLLAFRWIDQHTPPNALFLARYDALLYLYTGRRACWMFTIR